MSHVNYYQCDSCGKQFAPHMVVDSVIHNKYKHDSPLRLTNIPVTICGKNGKFSQGMRTIDLCSECYRKLYTVVDNYFSHIEVLENGEINVYPGRLEVKAADNSPKTRLDDLKQKYPKFATMGGYPALYPCVFGYCDAQSCNSCPYSEQDASKCWDMPVEVKT